MANERSSDVRGAGEFRSSANVKTGLVIGQKFGVKAVQYAVVDGDALFEGDIVLGRDQEIQARSDQIRAEASGAPVAFGVAITGAQYRWPNCVIPYDIDPTLPNQSRVIDAIQHWQSMTSYRFVARTQANSAQYSDYVTFRPSSGCSSNVGRQGAQQFVNLGTSCTTGNAIHEIGHVVGLWHEQSREDRDQFVTIHWDKVQPGFEHNFDQHITDGDDIGAYDYGSIMHYPRDAFSIDGSDTITPVDPNAQIGQRTGLSAGDIAAANSLCAAPATIKEAAKDPIETLKERVKDIRLDTRKEIVLDTRKEAIPDTLKEIPKDRIKDVAMDPVKGIRGDVVGPGPGPVVQPGRPGLIPFAVGTPHQAPAAAAQAGGTADAAAQIDMQLQQLAEVIAQAEATREACQRQYDELSAALQRLLDAADPEGSGRR